MHLALFRPQPTPATASSSTTNTIPNRWHGNKIASLQTPKTCQTQLESRAVQTKQRIGGSLSLLLGEETGGIIPRFGTRIISYHLHIPSDKCLETRYILWVGTQIRIPVYILRHISVPGNILPGTCMEYFPAPTTPANKIS